MKQKILVIVANPSTLDPLNIGGECNKIQEAINRSQKRNNYEVKLNFPSTEKELRQAIIDNRPKIVHFGGHGTEGGLCLNKIAGLFHSTL